MLIYSHKLDRSPLCNLSSSNGDKALEVQMLHAGSCFMDYLIFKIFFNVLYRDKTSGYVFMLNFRHFAFPTPVPDTYWMLNLFQLYPDVLGSFYLNL